ncbi:MAG: histidine kinase [Cytophagaceae bacterium]|nr:histidine kinase [Cytophagaceae bacterium]
MKNQESRYERARKRVKDIQDWYRHLIVYLVICSIYVAFNSGVFDNGAVSGYIPWWSSLTMPIGWGIGLFFHWLYVFKGTLFSKRLKHWEERKIQEYIEQEKSESAKFNKD